MSDTSMSAGPVFETGTPHEYQLSDDLARLCLPTEFKDEYRRLAWVDSICFLFLAVGLLGVKAPKIHVKPLVQPEERIQVLFTPPQEEQPKPEPVKPDEEPPPTPVDTPQVVRVVAVADAAKVAFPVPVQGAVAVASATYATPPPPVTMHAAAPPTTFNPAIKDGGSYPQPDYPGYALRNRFQGTVTIEIKVDASGRIIYTEVLKTSGYAVLDQAALDVVKNRWRFPPGAERHHTWACTFQMQ
jgi:TonB family protein